MSALPATTLYRFLPLTEAAAVTGEPVTELRERAKKGTILAGMLPNGSVVIAVSDDRPVETVASLPVAAAGDDINARLSQIRREDFVHLEGQPITVSEAAKQYDLLAQTIHAWTRQGLVRVIDRGRGRGSRKTVDESDVAYLAAIHHTRKSFGVKSGIPLLAPDGTPNLIKHPSLSQQRHQNKR